MDLDTVVDSGADDLRAQLESAFADGNSDDRPAVVEPAEPDGDAGAAVPSEKPSRSRDQATGQFVKEGQVEKPAAAGELAKPNDPDLGAAYQQSADGGGKLPVPPTGWSVEAKSMYAALPDAVKAAVAKREDEVNRGFAKLQTYKGLDEYVDMAVRSGTTLPEALKNYVAIERAFETDPPKALRFLCQRYKVDPRSLVEGGDGGRHHEGAAPAQPGAQTVSDPRIDHLMREISSIRSEPIQRQVADFFADPKNLYADDVAEDMVVLINSGRAKDLADAYDKACWARPDIRQLLINQQAGERERTAREKANAVASNARAAAKSVTGSPLPGASTTPDLSDLPLREQLQRAMSGAV